MISFEEAGELGVDGQRGLYADNHITGLVRDAGDCKDIVLSAFLW